MTTSTKKDLSLADQFEQIDSQVEVTDEEAKALLEEAGIDQQASLKFLMGEIADAEAKEKKVRLKKAALDHGAESRRLGERASSMKLPRGEVLHHLHAYQRAHPSLSAHFRDLNLDATSDEELRDMLAEIEELVGGAAKK